MSEVAAHGLAVAAPRGWDAEIYRRDDGLGPGLVAGLSAAATAEPELSYPTILHLATFALPPGRGDYGGGALGAMRATDMFLTLFEYTEGGTGVLFAHQGVPWPLSVDDFSPSALRVPQGNQTGCQRFFSVGHRAFGLYVVLGSHLWRGVLVPRVNVALSGVRIG